MPRRPSTAPAPVQPPAPVPAPTTTTTTVRFPRLQWATRDARLAVALTATAELVWPAGPPAMGSCASSSSSSSPGVFRSRVVPAARVAQLVRAGRLWVGSGGRHVTLAVQPMLAGQRRRRRRQKTQVGEGGLLAAVREAVLAWPSWQALGLEVREKEEDDDNNDACDDEDDGDGDSVLRLAVGQLPAPDGLYAAGGVPQARLHRVACQLHFRVCPDNFVLPPVAETGGTKKKKTKKKAVPRGPVRRAPQAGSIATAAPDPDTDLLGCGAAALAPQTAALVDAALHALVGVRPRRVLGALGVRPLDAASAPGSGAPSLLDVAPAVWSHAYFQAVASRAAAVPLVHRMLMSFAEAQSLRLRHKVEALVCESPAAPADEGLQAQLEALLLKGILQQQPPSQPKRIRTRNGVCDGMPRARLPSEESARSMHRQVTDDEDGMRATSWIPLSPPVTDPSPRAVGAQSDDTLMTELDDGSPLYEISMEDLERAFSLSPSEAFEEREEDEDEDCGEEAEEVDWQEIEAWSELHAWLEGEDSEIELPTREWGDEEENDEDPYAEYEHDGEAQWEPMEGWQLDTWPALDACVDGYGDSVEDEGVELWRNEDELVQED